MLWRRRTLNGWTKVVWCRNIAGIHGSLSRETVRRRLAENELKSWRRKMWCVPEVSGEYVARMEDVLDLYAEPPDPAYPVVCLDESPIQLIIRWCAWTRAPSS